MRQAHLQSTLSQGGVVINRGRLHQHVDEELTRLRGKGSVTRLHQQGETQTHIYLRLSAG